MAIQSIPCYTDSYTPQINNEGIKKADNKPQPPQQPPEPEKPQQIDPDETETHRHFVQLGKNVQEPTKVTSSEQNDEKADRTSKANPKENVPLHPSDYLGKNINIHI